MRVIEPNGGSHGSIIPLAQRQGGGGEEAEDEDEQAEERVMAGIRWLGADGVG